MLPVTFCLILFLLILIFQVCKKRFEYVQRFKHIPGPSAIPILGNALQLAVPQTEFFKLLEEWSKRYGSTFMLWVGQRPFVFLQKAEFVQHLLNSSIHIDKSLEYGLLHPFLGTGLVTSTGHKWQTRRKMLTPVFHYHMLENYLPIVLKQSHVLVEQLQQKVEKEPFNIVPFCKLLAMDVICELTLGHQLNSQTNSSSESSEYVAAIEEYMSITQRRFITPWLKPDFLFNLTPYAPKVQKCLHIVNTFSDNIIKKKKEELRMPKIKNELDLNSNIFEKKKGKVFLDLLLELSENENGSLLTEKDIQNEVNTFIFAGHDTTSVTLSWCLYVLGQFPEVQEKILKELNEKIPNFGNYNLKATDITNLEYLECCIKEVLRLYPAVPLIARQLIKPLEMKDQVIPPGGSVLVNVYSLHRDPENFSNPNAFNPDRFLSENFTEKNPFCYIPFSAGPRNCIGQKLAFHAIKILLANIIKNYEIKSIQKGNSLKLVAEVVLINEGGIEISIQRRKAT